MTQPTPSQIDELKPQERRYDLPIEDDFVVSVLPNGIKTWVYLYAADGRVQRRTLGVYPDMSLEAARAGLAAARATRRSLLEASERSARVDAARTEERAGLQARARAHPRRRSPALVAAAALVVVASGAVVAWRVADDRIGEARIELPAAVQAPVPAEGSGRPALADDAARTPAADAGDAAVPGADPEAASAADPDETVAAATPPEDASDVVPLSHVAAGAQVSADPDADAPDEAGASDTGTEALDSEAAAADAPARDDPAATAAEAPVRDDSAASEAAGTTTHDAHVTRALLVGGVVALEPVEPLGTEVVGVPGGVEKVYFYTELRGLGGERVLYRWLHEGRVEAEIPVTVGASWRWRTYSQKDLLPNKTGRWKAQLLDDDGRVLAETQFVYRNDAPQSADAS
jgi:hypothetical protein